MGYFDSKGQYVPRTLLGQRDRSSRSVRLGFTLSHLVVGLGALLAIFPFFWMLVTSVKPSSEIFSFPAHFFPSRIDFQPYIDALNRVPFARYLGNSLLSAGLAVALQLLLSAAAAYSFARLKPRGSKFWMAMVVVSLMIPFEALVIPLYLQMRGFPTGSGGLNLLNTYWVLILPASVSAFNIYVLRGFFERLPEEVLAQARLDGCSEWRVFFTFVLPMSRPILTVLGIFGFLTVWNGFFWPLVALNDPDMYTLMLGIQKLIESGEPWNVVMAAVTLTTVPTLLVFAALQRWIVRGMAFTGLQG